MIHQKNKILILLTAGATLLLFSCMKDVLFHSQQSIDNSQWNNKDTLVFAPNLVDQQEHTAVVEVRVKRTYPYKSITVVMETDNGKNIHKDTIKLAITDDNGNIQKGQLFLTQIQSQPIELPAQFTPKKIRIYHIMKRETLIGISDMGICLRR